MTKSKGSAGNAIVTTPPKVNKANKPKKSDAHKNPDFSTGTTNLNNISDGDISFDAPNTNNWQKCLEEVRLSCQGQIDALMHVIEAKDKLISGLSEKVGILSTEIEHLKKGYNFLSKDTTELKNQHSTDMTHASNKMNFLETKTQDLEDRSRRNNLVFFGIPESSNTEDCDAIICDILHKTKILDDKDVHPGLLERAHRLGRKKPGNNRPRPIIICCGSFKDKEFILNNSKKLKDTGYTVSEDFSRATLDIRRELVRKGKEAKTKLPSVVSFQLKYRRLVLKYQDPTTNKTFLWGFNLKDTQGSSNWFEPPNRRSANHQERHNADGYQSHA